MLKTKRAMDAKTVALVLKDVDSNHQQMARQVGLHPATVRKIRLGLLHKHVCPELARWEAPNRPLTARTCWNCAHHRVVYESKKDGTPSTKAAVRCGIGLPDPVHHGARFARDCAVFLHKDDADGGA